MPPKKSAKKKTSGEKYVTKKIDEHGNEIEEDEFHPQVRYPENGEWHNLRTLREELGARQRELQEAAAELPGLLRQYFRLQRSGNKMDLTKWRKTKRGKQVSRSERTIQSHAFRDAQANLEDFLYFQNSVHRWKRLGTLENAAQQAERRARQAKSGQPPPQRGPGPYLLPPFAEGTMARAFLDRYDDIGYGTSEHRHGLIDDIEGDDVAQTNNHAVLPVRPHHLRLWTPAPRRMPVGLPFEHLPPPVPNEPILDLEAILERWREVDERNDEDPAVRYSSHAERRRAERERYMETDDPSLDPSNTADKGFKLTRPSTSQILVNGEVTEDRFRKIQIGQGLFISALESSYDWRTSFDYLGPVKPSIARDFEISAMRDTIEHDRLPGDNVSDDEIDFGDEETERQRKEAQVPSKRKAPASAVEDSGEEIPTMEDMYPYEAQEFRKESKRVKLIDNFEGEDAPVVTPWAEETTGRREWHAYMRHSPSSEVNSPPHLPVQPGEIADDSIPAGFSLTEENAPHIHPPHKQRCHRNPERCRVWWNPDHPAEECWIPYPEEPTRSQDPIQWPILATHAPKDNPNDYLPSEERDLYRSRLYDHYGLTHNRGPESKEPQWPKVGVRVPYEPMTFDDMRLKALADGEAPAEAGSVAENLGGRTGNTIAKDAELRTAHEIRAMAVPIIEQPEGDWGWFPTDPPGGYGGGSDDGEPEEESDDEGDLFIMRYKEGSRPYVSNNPPPDDDVNGATPAVSPQDGTLD